jgi:hypothetical protein
MTRPSINQGDDRQSDDGQEMASMTERVAHEQIHNIRHEAIQTPSSNSPFKDLFEEKTLFRALGEIVQQNVIPMGYGVLPEEWENGSYPVLEDLQIGRKRGLVQVSLLDKIWLARSRLWVQGLYVLTYLREGENGGRC